MMCVCVCVTFGLGGHFEHRRALARPVDVVRHDPKAVPGVRHEVLDGDQHVAGTAGVDHPLPDQTQGQQRIFMGPQHF